MTLNLIKMQVSLKDFMGSDLTVANAARVSFGKFKPINKSVEVDIRGSMINRPVLDEADKKLIKYLAVHGHWTPFGHCSVQFHIKAPFFVARQLGKHQVGLVWNEISRRYVDSAPEFYSPTNWRTRAENKKQGSSDQTVEDSIDDHNTACYNEYKRLLSNNIAPEMARMVLPMSTMTEWYWSGSLYAFARVCKLRLASDTQEETRQIAKCISDICELLFPNSWPHLIA